MSYSPFRVYQIYHGISLHFRSTYDYTKYGPSTKRHDLESFNKARGKALYNKLYDRCINEQYLLRFLPAAFYDHNPAWIGDLFNRIDDAQTSYLRAKKVLSAPDYHVVREFKAATDRYGFKGLCSGELHNALNVEQLISPESICACDIAFGLLRLIVVEKHSLVQSNLVERLHKYRAFISLPNETDSNAIKLACRTHIRTQS